MEQTSSVREVEPEALHGYVQVSEYMEPVAWAAVYEDGEIVGHGCVTRLHGKTWAHDLAHWGKDSGSVAILYKTLIRAAKAKGVSKVLTDVSDERMLTLYHTLGWRLKSVILEGDI